MKASTLYNGGPKISPSHIRGEFALLPSFKSFEGCPMAKDLKFLKSIKFKDLVDYGVFSKCKLKKDQKEQYNKIHSYLNRMLRVNGEMKHIYKFTLSTNWGQGGRLFSGTSIQGIQRLIRGFLFRNTTTDIDCTNCHPVILRWLCKKHSISCPNLEYYINTFGSQKRNTLKYL